MVQAIAIPGRTSRPTIDQAIEAAEKYYERCQKLEKSLKNKTDKFNEYIAENLTTQEQLKQDGIGAGAAIAGAGLLGYVQGSDPEGEIAGFQPTTVFTSLGVVSLAVGISGLAGPHFNGPAKYLGTAFLGIAAYDFLAERGRESLLEDQKDTSGSGALAANANATGGNGTPPTNGGA